MLKIVICDDDLYIVKELETLCKKYIAANCLIAECIAVTNPAELFSLHPDILFLDVEMPEIGGIEVKNRLEEQGSGAYIIYVSSHPDSMQDAFGRNVIGFLTKPVDLDQFELLLDKAVDFSGSSRTVMLEDGSEVSSDDILVIRVSGNYTDVMTTEDVIKNQRKTLKAWQHELEAVGFIRVKAPYLVNCRWITGFSDDGKEVFVGEKFSLKVGEHRRKECREKYNTYCKKMARYL